MDDPLLRRRNIALERDQRARAWVNPDDDAAATTGTKPLQRSSSEPMRETKPHAGDHVVPPEGVSQHYNCPVCRRLFDAAPPNADTKHALRRPVLLVPCGHTVCRSCMKQCVTPDPRPPSQTQRLDVMCPICGTGQPISGTAFNRAVTSSLPNFIARLRQNPASEARAAADADIAPLAPFLRRLVCDYAVDGHVADQAESALRVGFAHQRLATLRDAELAVAREEMEDAKQSARSQSTVHITLREELEVIDREIRRLEVERQVVVSQLTEALQCKASGEVHLFECDARFRRIAEVAASHRQSATAELSKALQLVPSEALSSALRNTPP